MAKNEKIKILHMDNEEDTLVSVKAILEKEGYEVTSVNSGKAAVKEVEADGFSLVLLDIMMPDLSGWDVFTRIMKVDPNVRVAFLTVLEISPERKDDLRKHGVAEYILKPFERNEFVAKIRSILKQ